MNDRKIDKDTNVPSNDCISREAAIDALRMDIDIIPYAKAREYARAVIETVYNRLEHLPSAQPDLPEAYAKKVWTWLLDYQTTAAELKAKYSAYEVLSWVVNDWRRGHGGLN